MHFISILLFALSANIDNFLVGLSYGIKNIRVPLRSNLIIGIATFLGTLISMLAGKSVLVFLPRIIAKLIGGLIVFTIGLYYLVKFIYNCLKKRIGSENYDKYDKDGSGTIECREAIAVGFALAINSMGLGISASLTGMNALATSLAAFGFSLVSVYISNFCGRGYISKLFGKFGEPVSGVMIMLLGLYQLFL